MPWTDLQRRRFEIEKGILESHFTDKVTWINPQTPGEAKVLVEMTTNDDQQYVLQISLPKDFPNSCPDLVVVSPCQPLTKLNGKKLDASDHSYGVTKNNQTRICHFRPNLWTNENSLYQVFMKGRLWLEAYELHHQTGKPMKTFLREMPG